MSRERVFTVLVVDDEPGVRYTLRAILEDEPLQVEEAGDGASALERVRQGGIDLVITDLKMPGLGGMELLAELSAMPGAPRAVMITAYGSERLAVEAMQSGALDYFAKPFEPDDILRVVRRSVETVRLAEENARLRSQLVLAKTMIFESEAMIEVAERVERAAPRDVTVLITGESGTGKELVARALVQASRRSDRQLVTFNCGALPRELAEAELFGHRKGAFTGAERARLGLFREASGGTILLDEVGELHPQTQAALLRVLQEGEVRPVGADRPVEVDVRVLATTNRDLASEVRQGRFRDDLFYRLNVVEIRVPPLRERRDDIVPLAEAFARRYGDRFGLDGVRLSQRVLAHLRDAPWPGNVRQLEHVVESMVALAESALIDEDPFDHGLLGRDREGQAGAGSSLKDRVGRFERDLIARELKRFGGNQSQTARSLGVSRVTLIDKMKKYGLRRS